MAACGIPAASSGAAQDVPALTMPVSDFAGVIDAGSAAEMDRLDVCDARDEAAHGYRYLSRRGEILLAGSVGIGPVPLPTGETTLADAGRLIVGGESFRVRTRGERDQGFGHRQVPDDDEVTTRT